LDLLFAFIADVATVLHPGGDCTHCQQLSNKRCVYLVVTMWHYFYEKYSFAEPDGFFNGVFKMDMQKTNIIVIN